MTKEQAVYQFFNQFLPAYEENSVDKDAQFPYLTYNLLTSSFDHPVAVQRSLWYRGSSWLDVYRKTSEIADKVSRGGVIVRYDNGAIWITRGEPFAQNMRYEPDVLIKRELLNFTIEFLSEN